jgi:Tfp pilus assembly protein PilF
MKRGLTGIAIALVVAVHGMAQSAAPVIKDPAEYNMYVGAIQQQYLSAKIAAMEQFLIQYPGSVMKEETLQALMGAYQQAGNPEKMKSTALRLLQANGNNVRALAVLVFMDRSAAEQNQNPQQNLADAAEYANRGLDRVKQASKPSGMSDGDYKKLTDQVSVIFNGALGLAALRNKDYTAAQQHLLAAVEIDPNDIRNVYPLGLAYLTANSPDPTNGLFFIARAASLASGLPAQSSIEDYGKKQYIRYHNTENGWTDLLLAAKKGPVPSGGFPALVTSVAADPRISQSPTQSQNNAYEEQLKNANALYKGKQLSEAMQTAAALIKEDPNRWEGYLLMGAIQEDKNMPEAKASYQRALDLAPGDLKHQIAQQIQALGKQ